MSVRLCKSKVGGKILFKTIRKQAFSYGYLNSVKFSLKTKNIAFKLSVALNT